MLPIVSSNNLQEIIKPFYYIFSGRTRTCSETTLKSNVYYAVLLHFYIYVSQTISVIQSKIISEIEKSESGG